MKPNILLIVCDTLRKDVLRQYGGRANTPNVDELAKEAMVYNNAVAPSPWTIPTHISMLTGKYPSQHGIHEGAVLDFDDIVSKCNSLNVPNLPSYLSSIGYLTFGISGNPWVSRYTGLGKSFDSFENVMYMPRWVSGAISDAEHFGPNLRRIAFSTISKGRLDKLALYAAAWSRKVIGDKLANYPVDKGATATVRRLQRMRLASPFFGFINLVEAHEPYGRESDAAMWEALLGKSMLPNNQLQQLKRKYLKEVEYMDKKLGTIIEILKDRGIYDETLIIITSDHGQAFGEHGFLYHGRKLYDEVIEVPLIVKFPHGKKFEERRGYQSLVNMFGFVRNFIESGNDAPLTSETAFSESFGFCHKLPVRYGYSSNDISADFKRPRVAILNDSRKIVLSSPGARIEEFQHPDSTHKPDKKAIRKMAQIYKSMSRSRGIKIWV